MHLLHARRAVSISVLVAATTFVMAAAGCDGTSPMSPGFDSTGIPGSSGGSGGDAGTGTLTLKITDSPFSDAKAVLVTFSEVSAHRSGSGWQTLPFVGGSERTCDLKKLQGPVDLLGVGALPAGHYTQIRLNVDEAEIFFDNESSGPACAFGMGDPGGRSADVEIPSGEVKLNHQFTIESGGATTITLDFDGDKSITRLGGGNGNGGGGNGNSNGNGNGNGRGNNPSADEDDTDAPEDGRYQMKPVIGIVSVQ